MTPPPDGVLVTFAQEALAKIQTIPGVAYLEMGATWLDGGQVRAVVELRAGVRVDVIFRPAQ